MQHDSAFLAIVSDAKTRINEISTAQLADQLDTYCIIDVRETKEWEQGRIKGAQHLSKGIIECYIETVIPDKETKIVVYCGGGFRSALAADNLQKMGYSNVYSLAGGWRTWQQSGGATET